MSTSFAIFWKRNLGFFRLAILTNLEYRLNFFTDIVIQPITTMLIEFTLWFAIFRSSGQALLAGYPKSNYLSYALWAAFIGRITSNWMYEFRMIEEVDSGSINSLMVRPISFYEYYLSQFFGYKFATTAISLLFPIAVAHFYHLPTDFSRLPAVLLLTTYYLLLVYTISVCITSTAFFLNKVQSLTVAKNLCLWLLSGELFPLDMLPSFWKNLLLSLPFSSAVYIPVGYLTGRIGTPELLHAFSTVTLGLAFFGLLARLLWKRGTHIYTGTGA